jgi:predicted nucleic acid-binding Zn ribbon protein
MIKEKTTCEYCSKELEGRKDKTFCNRRCKELSKQRREQKEMRLKKAIEYNKNIVEGVKLFIESCKKSTSEKNGF